MKVHTSDSSSDTLTRILPIPLPVIKSANALPVDSRPSNTVSFTLKGQLNEKERALCETSLPGVLFG